jgi:glycogen(starch) synthase
MRVMYWQESFWPSIGGVQTLSARLLPALRELGWQLVVITRQDNVSLPERETFRGIPVCRLPFYQALQAKDPTGVGEMRRAVMDLKHEFRPDLVHISSLGPSMFFHLETCGRHVSPLLVTAHAYRYSQSLPPDSLLRRTLKAADWISCVSAALLGQMRQVFPDIAHRSSVLHNGLQPPGLTPTDLPFDTPVILGIGRLIHSKGFDIALEAFSTIRGRFPGARLILLGDGFVRNELKLQATKLGIDESVHFAGWIAPEQIYSWINAATMVIVPSRSEPFGMVALEAGVMGRPVVATKVGGLSEIIVHERTGLLVQNEDAASMAEAIAHLINHPEATVRMGKEARNRVTEKFSWERCVESYDLLYRRLMGRG